ncbi:TPA: glycosyltransferase family 4 protein [Streptococcus suis]
MKKILYLHAGAEMYGADKVLRDLIAGLDKSQFEAHVILPNSGVLVEELQKVGAMVSVLEYPILRRKYFNPKGLFTYITSYTNFSKKIVDYAKKNEIDIIHNNTTAVLEGIYIKRKLGIPLVWHVHEIIMKPKIIASVINMLMGVYADKIITVSNAVKSHIQSSKFIKDNQTQVIYNGVDNSEFYPQDSSKVRRKFKISNDKKIIGMVGRVNAWKGQHDFVKAATPILKEDPSIVAFLAGGVFEGEEWRIQELEELINKTGVKEQIYRIDYYPNPVELYNMYDIFVLPSTNPDPLPTVVLEAMACGKPIIGYEHGGICEMVNKGYNGLLALPKDTKKLSEAISEVLLDQGKVEQFGRHSISRQKKYFSLDSYVGNFTELYKKL